MQKARCWSQRSSLLTSTHRSCWHPSRSRRCTVRVHAEVFELGGSWVVAPSPKRAGLARPPIKGVVHFLGGAFAGAAPQILYSLLLDIISSAGYTVIATPYAVTFQHLECADAVRNQFQSTLELVRQDPRLSSLAPSDRPVFGIGHSNGALLHLLIGSRHPGTTSGNIVISFNNKQVSDAIPIPGFLGTVSPTIAALNTAPPLPLPVPLPDSSTVLQTIAGFIPKELKVDEAGQLSRAALALDQIASVFKEVGDGVTEFSPSPSESRQLIQQGYDANRSPLLLIRFEEDTIDETPEMASLLQAVNPIGVSTLTLPGSHVTPCGGDIPWQTGNVFTPVDVLAQIAKAQAQTDVRRLGTVVTDFLNAAAM